MVLIILCLLAMVSLHEKKHSTCDVMLSPSIYTYPTYKVTGNNCCTVFMESGEYMVNVPHVKYKYSSHDEENLIISLNRLPADVYVRAERFLIPPIKILTHYQHVQISSMTKLNMPFLRFSNVQSDKLIKPHINCVIYISANPDKKMINMNNLLHFKHFDVLCCIIILF